MSNIHKNPLRVFRSDLWDNKKFLFWPQELFHGVTEKKKEHTEIVVRKHSTVLISSIIIKHYTWLLVSRSKMTGLWLKMQLLKILAYASLSPPADKRKNLFGLWPLSILQRFVCTAATLLLRSRRELLKILVLRFASNFFLTSPPDCTWSASGKNIATAKPVGFSDSFYGKVPWREVTKCYEEAGVWYEFEESVDFKHLQLRGDFLNICILMFPLFNFYIIIRNLNGRFNTTINNLCLLLIWYFIVVSDSGRSLSLYNQELHLLSRASVGQVMMVNRLLSGPPLKGVPPSAKLFLN